MKIKNSPVCSYCDQTDDIGHFFFMCKNVYEFWKRICTWWNTLDYDDADFPVFPNVKTVIFGSQCITETVAVLNFCMFHIKYHIYRQQLFQDNVFHLHEIQKSILAKLEIEKNMSKRKEKLQIWQIWNTLWKLETIKLRFWKLIYPPWKA